MKQLSFISLVLVVAVCLGYWQFTKQGVPQGAQMQSLQAGSALTAPRTLPPFHFTTQYDKAFGKQQLKDYWSFVFFGYSSCPELCPNTLQHMKQLSQRVGKGVPVQYVFVSIDPIRDTSERLTQYFQQQHLNEINMIGLHAPQEQVHKLAKQIGIFFNQEQPENTVHIEHSGAIVLINPDAKLDTIFTDSNQPGTIAQDFKQRLSVFARG
jgi:protein SCO1/2